MNRLLKVFLLTLIAMVPLLGGCVKPSAPLNETTGLVQTTPLPVTVWPPQGARPSGILGFTMPVTLSQEDKDRISFYLTTFSSYYPPPAVTSFQWYAIIWAPSGVPAAVWTIDEQTALKGIPAYVNPNALWYPGLTLTNVIGGVTYIMQAAVDYDSCRIVYSAGSYLPPDAFPQLSK